MARSGDHPFVVGMAGRAPAGLSGEAARLIETIERSDDIAGQPVAVRARVGVAVCPEDGREAEELLGDSQVALHHAGRSGGQPVQRFALHMRPAALRRVSMGAQLRRAIETESFELRCQPTIPVRRAELCGLEALLRCRQVRRGQEEGGPVVPVAVNLSAVRLLQLEITETAVMGDPAQIAAQLSSLARLGVTLALDDFGSGYSNLAQRVRLPLAAIKLDRSVVLRVATHAHAASVLGAIVGIGHTLGLRMVAEGVETREQLEALRAAGCDECQGYLIATPMSAADLREWVHRPRGPSRVA